MNEIKNTMWNKRMPSLFGFFFLILAIGTIGWLSRNAILFGTKAALSSDPRDIQISNISDSSFAVSFITDASTLGTVNYGENGKTDQIKLDLRDQSANKPQQHNIHFITIANLKPSTKYTFSITSGDKIFLNNGSPYEVTTTGKLETSSEKKLLQGKITLDDGTLPTEAIAYASAPNSQLLATLVKADGTYEIDLTNLKNKDLSSLLTLNPNDIIKLLIADATRQSHASLLANQVNPVPMIILSKDYDFTVSNQPLPTPIASESAELSGTPAGFPIITGSTQNVPEIVSPQKEQSFKDQQPLFKGKAIPNANVTITINSPKTITTTVKSDTNGNWQFRPNVPLDPGNHTITISTIDASGLIKTITRSFTVYAAGSQFTEPSVSPTQKISPTTTPTATPTPRTTTVTPTPTVIKIPTLSPTLTLSTSPAPSVPVTGNNTSLILSLVGVVSAVSVGALLFFLTAL
ncbi:hypothetical protein HZA75_06525 [Candidatus Roizmanbacteria bacterium]|nr:hypothetical protein [Candidatus Roizmanbacteria bacterium]